MLQHTTKEVLGVLVTALTPLKDGLSKDLLFKKNKHCLHKYNLMIM